MDRSLWLLMRLRVKGTFRRWKVAMSRPKGIILGLLTAFLFVPMLIGPIATSFAGIKPPIEEIRRFAPLGLFAFTLIALLSSAGEAALYYSPAEVTFLFAGPYGKRGLLAYKLMVSMLLCLFSSVFFVLGSASISPSFLSSFVGSFLLLVFFQTMQMAIGLASGTLGKLAFSRGRKLILLAFGALVAVLVASAGSQLASGDWLETVKRMEASPVLQVVITPFRWFVMTFTARGIVELLKYGSFCVVVDAMLTALVFALDASYFEAASNSSAKRFAKMQRMMGGGGGVRAGARRTGRFQFKPPKPPWWGGVGPNFWRQMTTALGSPTRLLGLMALLLILPILFGSIGRSDPKTAAILIYVTEAMVIWMSISISGLLPYDFRGDIDVMEELKTLPITPTRMALSQVMTPAIVATVAQTVSILLAIVVIGGVDLPAWGVLAFLLPLNLLFYCVENLLFLWYPSRMVAGQFDILAIGRQILFLIAKVTCLFVGGGLAAGLALLVYFLLGRSVLAAMAVGWIVMAAASMSLVPMVGKAFTQFDVARDIPA